MMWARQLGNLEYVWVLILCSSPDVVVLVWPLLLPCAGLMRVHQPWNKLKHRSVVFSIITCNPPNLHEHVSSNYRWLAESEHLCDPQYLSGKKSWIVLSQAWGHCESCSSEWIQGAHFRVSSFLEMSPQSNGRSQQSTHHRWMPAKHHKWWISFP